MTINQLCGDTETTERLARLASEAGRVWKRSSASS
jgi:hypothetical protein